MNNFEISANFNAEILELNQADIESYLNFAGIEKERWLMPKLRDFCYNKTKRLLGICGLRRTGKSVMMWTMALELINSGKKVIFWELTEGNTASAVVAKLKALNRNDFDYLFIDEATFAEDFPSWGLFLYNTFGRAGKHVIVSGTYSYALRAAADDLLFDRINLITTTVIPYAEYNFLTGKGIDDFLVNGGLLDPINEKWEDYLNTAVINNLVASLKKITNPKYKIIANMLEDKIRSYLFYIMQELYLRPVLESLSTEYEYPELEQSLRNLARGGELLGGYEVFRTKFDISATIGLMYVEPDNTKAMLMAFRNVLLDMNLIDYIDILTLGTDSAERSREYFITQSGLMYYVALVSKDSVLRNITNNDELMKNIENVVRGRILETTVIQDTKYKYPDSDVVQLRSDRFEIDMVISHKSGDIDVYEIKHSEKPDNTFSRCLRDERLPQILKQIYGKSNTRHIAVLYRGEETNRQDVKFLNVHDFLISE